MPFEQELQKAVATPVGRKSANFDYNKNKKERLKRASTDEADVDKNKKPRREEDNTGDFSVFGSPLSIKK